jgi:acyl-CoA thioesterase FadM
MKDCTCQIVIDQEHLDSRNHANWISQLAIMENCIAGFLKRLIPGIDNLREKGKCCFMVVRVKDAYYPRQVFLGDVIDVSLITWIVRLQKLESYITFRRNGIVTTEAHVVMMLVNIETQRLVTIPKPIVEVIGIDVPQPWQIQPAPTS